MNTIMPFIFSIIAGLSTILGFTTINLKTKKEILIKNSLAFASGVMLTISIIDLIPESIKLLAQNTTNIFNYLLISSLIGFIIPSFINNIMKKGESPYYKLGILSMIAIIIHNIPEGVVTYLSASANIKLGLRITLAIALHNIPEGISIAVPLYIATKNKKIAFKYTTLAALSEPFGALLVALFLKGRITDLLLGIIFSITAGIMTNLSIIELLPESLKYKEKKKTIFFFIIGTIIMYISIILTK